MALFSSRFVLSSVVLFASDSAEAGRLISRKNKTLRTKRRQNRDKQAIKHFKNLLDRELGYVYKQGKQGLLVDKAGFVLHEGCDNLTSYEWETLYLKEWQLKQELIDQITTISNNVYTEEQLENMVIRELETTLLTQQEKDGQIPQEFDSSYYIHGITREEEKEQLKKQQEREQLKKQQIMEEKRKEVKKLKTMLGIQMQEETDSLEDLRQMVALKTELGIEMTNKISLEELKNEKREKAVTKIQAGLRGWKARKKRHADEDFKPQNVSSKDL